MSEPLAQFGMIGLATMGRNLVLNLLDRGISVAAWNLESELTAAAVEESQDRLRGCESLEGLVANLERPRRIMMMIKAGKPVDIVLGQLLGLLDPGDVVIDGGNSFFEDTQRRQATASEAGVHFFGVGVSGGSEGARHGPSLMPGGDASAYESLRPILEAIAAKTDSGPCVAYLGTDGAGHFVKMVHNGIEYAVMQLIAEAYDVMQRILGMQAPELADTFSAWNAGPLESYLIEISAKIFHHETDGAPTIDAILDRAGQKGTGRWTARLAIDLGVPTPSIAAAVDARVLSSLKADRITAGQVLKGPSRPASPERASLLAQLEQALLAANAVVYAQGMDLIRGASSEHGWGIDLREVARIWKGGCIIRAALLDSIMQAYGRDPELRNLLLDEKIADVLHAGQSGLRACVGVAQAAGIPTPVFAASLAYFDSYRTARLPQNLTQAQRDAFGAHTYRTLSDPDGPAVHTEWLS